MLYLLDAKSEIDEVPTNRDWSRTLRVLDEHGVSGYAHSLGKEAPGRVVNRLEQVYNWQKVNTAIMLEELDSVYNSLDVQMTVLKGACLVEDIYSEYGMRSFSDVDLLISEGDLEQVKKGMKSLGYEYLNEKRWEGNDFKWNFKKVSREGLSVIFEFHSHLFMHLDNEIEWRRDESTQKYARLIIEDLLIHLCGHLVYQHNFTKLYWLLDIHLLLKKYADAINWSSLFERAREVDIEKSLTLSFMAVESLFGKNENLHYERKSIYRPFLSHDFLISPRKSPLTYFIIKHIKNSSLKSALRYDIQNLRSRIKK